MYINPRGKLMRHLDRLHELQKSERPVPINVEIDLSNRCGLGCEWCHFAHTHSKGPHADRGHETGDLLSAKHAISLTDELAGMGVRSVTWSGGGEPTLHPFAITIFESCMLPQGIYTNGNQITEKLAVTLRRTMEWVYVSLDAANAADYAMDKRCAPDRFNDVCEGVRRLVHTRGQATIGVGFLLDAHNWHLAAEMADLGLGLGADYVQFRPVIRYHHNSPGAAVGNRDWIVEFLNWWQRMKQSQSAEIDMSRFVMLRDWRHHGYKVCWWSALQSVVTPDGRVWACLNKRGYLGACLGNIHKQSFTDIWKQAPIQNVDDQCRVMCRGHIPNLSLDAMMAPCAHQAFV